MNTSLKEEAAPFAMFRLWGQLLFFSIIILFAVHWIV